MSRYTRIFVRFLPNPQTQEFINVGVIVGDGTSRYWATHKAKCEMRIMALDAQFGVNEVEEFFTWLDAHLAKSNQLTAKAGKVGLAFFTKLQIQNSDKRIQLSTPETVEAHSPESYIASIIGSVILEDSVIPLVTDNTTRHPGNYKASEIGRELDNCLDPLGRKDKSDGANALTYIWKALDSFINATESLLETISDHYLDELEKRNNQRRMKDPVYSNIERRRRPEGHTSSSIIFLSEEHNLRWEDYEVQFKIRQQVDYAPWWYGLAKYLGGNPISRALAPIQNKSQKATRGWVDSDLWSLDSTLCSRLGEQLLALSHNAHGYPGVGIYSDPDRWMEDLHKHGYALLVYGNLDSSHNKIDEDYFTELESEPEDSTGENTRFDKENARETYAYMKAQESLRWVASYLEHLWD